MNREGIEDGEKKSKEKKTIKKGEFYIYSIIIEILFNFLKKRDQRVIFASDAYSLKAHKI